VYLNAYGKIKALQKTEFSKIFIFVSFGIVRLPKFRNFLEKSSFSEFAKFLQKTFGNMFGSKTLVFESKNRGFGVKNRVLGVINKGF